MTSNSAFSYSSTSVKVAAFSRYFLVGAVILEFLDDLVHHFFQSALFF